jgi:YbdK family carboxylate-amine ligase
VTLDQVGCTVGVEEEYHLVDPIAFTLAPRPELAAQVAAGLADRQLRAEMLTSQLEAVTEVCTTLADVRASLVSARRAATAAAEDHGATILASSTHPFATLSEIDIMAHPRYERLLDRFGAMPRQFNLCGCHVHVAVPDLDTAVRVLTHARPYLPLLVALSGSSPFHDGVDTGHVSWRTALLALWPQGGPPPPMASGEEYRTVVADLQRSDLVDEPSALLWELRPSTRYPTLEFRGPDVCTDVDDAVLIAALVRSLVRTLARRVDAEQPAQVPADSLLRAARWRAGRFGLDGALWSFSRGELVDGRAAVRDLLAELRPDLEEHGEYDTASGLTAALLDRGSSAARQRSVARRGGGLHAVVRDGLALTTAG